MVNTVIFDDQIKLWWDYTKLQDKNSYSVYLGDKKLGETTATHFNVKELDGDTEYTFTVKLEDGKGGVLKEIGTVTAKTLKTRIRLDVTKAPYNAVGDGVTMNTKAIQQAIDDCKDGECVYIPDGTFMTGGLMLHSDMELRLSDNAVLQGSEHREDYLPKIKSRFEGYECICYRSFINLGDLDHDDGYNCKNVIIRGGTMFGGGKALRDDIIEYEKSFFQEETRKAGGTEDEIYSFDNNVVLPGRTRGRCMQIANSQNVIIADTICGKGASWQLHFIYSDNIVTCGCKIISGGINNGDGWDPDSATNCVVFDTEFITGDDCVAIKSGKNPEGNEINRPTIGVKVFDCIANGGFGIAIGSEMAGGVKDVKIWNCKLINTWGGINVKAPPERGAFVTDVEAYNVLCPSISVVQRYRGNHGTKPAPHPPILRNFTFEDITVTGICFYNNKYELSSAVSFFGGEEEEYKIHNVKLKNIRMKHRTLAPYQDMKFDNVVNVTMEDIISE